ncbi:PE-PGRS family protein [Streptomyces luteolus]|uniref:PE-PGRS family protein n=1 Tax=Streptomyces luteolus TaxID=3043615 RepID=A0ABT6T8Y4_9ACTN|nr:PE-PGRS family protein [Streptomyces sp. B-S-A12]MDI3424352.1 PE-PGRS family protein [Streptomyces sp. B-S-A12]
MYRWSPLNDRQLSLLTRIGEGTDPVTSASPELTLTARALKERGLITMPKHSGKWQAEITDDGRFYLAHGHHPDRPEPTPRKKKLVTGEPKPKLEPKPKSEAPPRQRTTPRPDAKPAPTRPAKPRRRSAAEIGAALIAEVQQADRFLRIPDPSAEERASYRRAFDAARQCAPEGYHLKYSGRAKGDFFLGLLRVTGEDDTEWNRIRLARSRVITDVEDVIAAVTADHSAFEISDEVLPRVLSLLRLLAEQALARHGEMKVSKKRRQPRPLITVHGRTYEISFKERQKQVRYVPKQSGRRTYDWQRVTPAHRFEPSGELELHVGQGSRYGNHYGWEKRWADTAKEPLEAQIVSVFRALKARAEAQEKGRLAWEAEQQRLAEERERQDQERRRREAEEQEERRRREAEEKERTRREWEAAVSVATIKATDAMRVDRFSTALAQWRAAGEMRAFCAALDEAASATDDRHEAGRLREWSQWGKAEADRLDPAVADKGLTSHSLHAEPTGDELRPFLDGWHPHRPEKKKPPRKEAPEAETKPPKPEPEPERWRSFTDERLDQGWRYGRRGRAQWWRR